MWKKRIDSFKYALQGIRLLYKSEIHAKFHLFFATIAIILSLFFRVSMHEWIAIIFAITIVFSAEAFNTALEKLTDLVSPDIHPIAGKVKDLAAGAVLICAIGAAVVGFIIFFPKFFN